MSRFLAPDHSAGDESTIGGYEAVHGRPAALEGPDGFAYSVAILADASDDAGLSSTPTRATGSNPSPAEFGAYFLFLRWRRIGEEGVEGHVESELLEFADSAEQARQQLGAWPITRVQAFLNAMVGQGTQ